MSLLKNYNHCLSKVFKSVILILEKYMIKIKKALLISSLVSLGITCLFFILGIFGLEVFKGVPFRFLLIFATLCVGCGFMVNELSVLKRNKLLAIISISCLTVSILFALIIFCSPLLDNNNAFNTITAIIALFSTFFMIVISLCTKLEKRILPLQIICYIVLFVLEILLSLLIGGYDLFKIDAMTEIFSVICVVAVGLLIALWILSSKKESQTNSIDDKLYVKILKTEYEALKAENQKLKTELEELKK